MNKKWLIFLLTITVVMVCACRTGIEFKHPPLAVAGMIDLTDWSFETNGPINLSGEYRFYWNQLYSPQSFKNEIPIQNSALIKVPGSWNGLEWSGQRIPGTGYATYRLIVLLNGNEQALALKVADMSTALSLFVDGKPLYSAGVVGKSEASSRPQFNPQVIAFRTDKKQLEIVIQVSNFHHRKGGAWEPILLGTEDQLRHKREASVGYELFLFGSILIMGIYHLGLFILRRKDRSTLFFSLFSLLIALRILTTGERYFLQLFPNFSWDIFVKLEYLSYYLAVLAFLYYFYTLFYHRYFKMVCWVATVWSVLLTALVTIFPISIFSYTLIPYHLSTLALFTYGIYILITYLRRGEPDAIIFFVGFLVLLLTAMNDMMYHANVWQTGNFVSLGLLIFIFSQAYLLSSRFSNAFETVDIQRQALADTNQIIQQQVKKSKQAEKALKVSHERFLTVLDSINADIYVADMDTYEILFMNRHMKDSFGKDFTGQICWQVFRNSSKACDHCSNDKLLNDEGRPTGVHIWEGRNPITQRWYINYDRAIPWDNDRFVRLEIATDVTEMKQTETKLQNAKDTLEMRVRQRTKNILRTNEILLREIKERKQAQEASIKAKRAAEVASRAKSAFLANMSHELRTPLNHIIGFTELILDKHFGELNDVQAEYLGDVHQSSEHLFSLINDILDISKIESGKVTLNREDVDLAAVVQNSLKMIQEKAMKKTIRLFVEIKEIPPTVHVDERSMKQIMYNLLSNAIKFTPANGQINVSAQCRQLDGHDTVVEISVSDDGIGIEPKDISRIFKPFEQVEDSTSRKYQGTGLGLALSKNLAELHGGKMWAESDGVGKGAVFHFAIPI